MNGFSLLEAMITLALTAILMIMSWQIFFAMKRSADQMWLNTEPRQIARRASEYVGSYVRGAADLHPQRGNPVAIMVWWEDGNASTFQSSWNNVTDANLADVGTDIITLGSPVSALNLAWSQWPGSNVSSNPAEWLFALGCDGSANEHSNNLAIFKQLTGAYTDSGGNEVSPPLMIVNPDSDDFAFYMITSYQDGNNASCCDSESIEVIADPAAANQINPPGFRNIADPRMRMGLRWITFRVRNGWLEQKAGIFNPNTDNPGNDFAPLLPDVEDLQIAWIYRDGTVWNTASQQLPTGTYANNVPSQGTTNAYDVINVVGLRVTVTARSSSDADWEENPRFRRPAAEDRPAGNPDRFYHESSTVTAMVRNRVLER